MRYSSDYIVESLRDNSINEAKVVTFDGKSNPDFGQAVIMAGGAGSGKGTALKSVIMLQGKIFDVDELKQLYVKGSKAGIFDDIRGGNYDFKNPDDVALLHQKVKELGLKDRREQAFFSSLSTNRLPNIVFDITGDEESKLTKLSMMCKDIGYKVSLVWVVANREEAFIRNLQRDRTVPDEVFHATHNNVKTSVFSFLEGSGSKFCDSAWVVFSSGASAEDMTPDEKRALENNRVIKLEKKGSKFVVPDKVYRKIMKVTGRNEIDPKNPQNYVSQKEFAKDGLKDAIKSVRGGKTTVRKTIFNK